MSKMIKRLFILGVVLFSSFNISSAQITFQKTFGGTDSDGAGSVQQTTDGGYIITGSTRSFGAIQDDLYLIKTNVNGDTVWTKIFGGTWYDDGWSVRQTTDGG